MLKVGDRVPDFTLVATTGQDLSLSAALSGKKAAVLTTFPLCFTGN